MWSVEEFKVLRACEKRESGKHPVRPYVHARKSLDHFNITFEMNKCFAGENSALPTI